MSTAAAAAAAAEVVVPILTPVIPPRLAPDGDGVRLAGCGTGGGGGMTACVRALMPRKLI